MATLLFWQKPAFCYPLRRAARTAVLVPWFRSTDMAWVFANGWSVEALRFGPQAVAGTRQQLLELMEDKAVQLTHAVIALARPGEASLTSEERELLWRRFGVPVFEQIIGLDGSEKGQLLAAECEAHDGLHVVGERTEWPSYKVESAPCGCGKTTPRILGIETAQFAAS